MSKKSSINLLEQKFKKYRSQANSFANGASELENKHKKFGKTCCNHEYSML